MITIETLRRWRPDDVAAVADRLRGERDRLLGIDDELAGSRAPFGWSGTAAQAWTGLHERVSEQVRRLVAGVEAALRASAQAADDLRAVQRALTEAERIAHSFGMAVTEQGVVVDRSCVTGSDAAAVQREQLERERVRQEITDRIEQIQRRSTDVDLDLYAVLRRITADAVDGAATTLAAAAAAGGRQGALTTLGLPRGASPASVAGWWATLTPAERDYLTAVHADELGNLDGVPAAARDRANRARLGRLATELDARAASLQARIQALQETMASRAADRRVGLALPPLQEQLTRVRSQRAALDGVASVVRRPGRQLLLLDLGGSQPKAAVAVGDVDTAAHVAVFTPGFTTTVAGSIKSYDGRMDGLRRRADTLADLHGDGGTVAAVAWLGYEAPQWDGIVAPGRSVATDGAAERGAEPLARFYEGIAAGRATEVHLTALGHSYGSLTTGLALPQQQAAVDHAVFFGSPGIGSDVKDLNTSTGQAYVIEAKDDAVADLGAFNGDPNQLVGLTNLSARGGVTPDGDQVTASTGHSAYLADTTMSQYNLAAVVAGVPARAVGGREIGVGDWLW